MQCCRIILTANSEANSMIIMAFCTMLFQHAFSVCCNNCSASFKSIAQPYNVLHLYTVDDGQGNAHRTKYRGIVHATVSITREEGLLALYRVKLCFCTYYIVYGVQGFLIRFSNRLS